MSHMASPARTASTAYTQHRDFSSSSTAYTGFEGFHNDDLDLERSDYQSLRLPTPPLLAARPALSSRLLSTLSNSSQPALTRSRSIIHSRAKSFAALVPGLNSIDTLFAGESAPVKLGVAAQSPTKEKDESELVMEYRTSFTERPAAPRRSRSSMVVVEQAPKTAPEKKGWFSRKATSPLAPAATASTSADDLASLNLAAALFPHGRDQDLTPASFNDLLLTATALLTRFQTAHKSQADYINSVRPELEAQREEVEEAETRSRHLKMQLQDMALRAQEQETAMRELADQLAREKTRAAELESRASEQPPPRDEKSSTLPRSRPTVRPRTSPGESSSASDSGFESEIENDGESVVLGSESGVLHSPWSCSASSCSFASPSPGPGRDEISAWATVEQLRGENRGLKARVRDMEGELQMCIDLVRGTGA